MVKRAKLRKITAGLLAFMLVTSALPVGDILPIDSGVSFGITVSAEDGDLVDSGSCGATSEDSVEWKLTENGEKVTIDDVEHNAYTLTISGSGEMAGYPGYNNRSPWESYKQYITSVYIADGVTSIGEEAFILCEKLTSVTIGKNVTSIGAGSFYGCSALTSVTIPDSVTSIGRSAFYACSSLTSVTIPDSVTSIGGAAFCGCKKLESVTIPDSVTSIGGAAFYGCKKLKSVTIPDRVESIGDNTFYECFELTSVTIGKNVKSIGISSFSDCSALTSVTIPNSVTSIGNYAFSRCYGLTSVTIPCSVRSFGSYVFKRCPDTLEYHLVKGSYADKNISTNKVYDQYHSFIGADGKANTTDEKCLCGEVYNINYSGITVTQSELEYDGTAKTPTFTLTDKDGNVISADNYEVTATEQTDAGDYPAIITGINNYAGTREVTWAVAHTHNPATKWTSDSTGHWHTCPDCTEKVDFAAHISDNGTVTKPATETEEGVRTYKCTVCGYVMRTETIPVIKPDYYPNYNPNYNTYTPSVSVTPSYNFEQIKLTGKISKNNVILKWTDIEDADKYTVYQLVDGKYKALKTTTKNTYTVKNLPTGKYKFIVRYTTDGRISPISKCNSLNVNIKNSKPYPVATVKNNVVTLKWQPVDNAEKYAIYLVKDGKATKLKETEKTSVRYKLKPGKEYQFVVRAYVDGKWTTMKTSDIVKVTAEE